MEENKKEVICFFEIFNFPKHKIDSRKCKFSNAEKLKTHRT